MFSQIWTQLALVKSEQREDQAKGVNLKFKGEDEVRVEDSTQPELIEFYFEITI